MRSRGPLTGSPSASGSQRSLPVRTLFLIDGEHYPPVVLDAIKSVEESLGAEGVAAAFLGGTEKLKEGTDYGVPLVKAEKAVSAVEKGPEEHAVEGGGGLSEQP